MVGKRCPAPRSGGSARNAIFYVLAEELSAKVQHDRVNDPIHAEQRVELSALMTESLARPDRGVGVVWSPSTAADGRPSSVFARGVTSLYSADIEIQTLFDAQSRVRSPVAHFIFSLSTAESATVSDEQLIRASLATLDGAGWSGHAAVAAVHQDTMKFVDGELVEGNKHCHVAIASVNSRTLRAYDRTQEYMRLHKSLREQELVFNMDEDWGLYKIADRGLPTQRIFRTDAVDWEARKQERASERAERLARNFVSDHSLESVRDREDRIVHALRDYLDRCDDRGEKPLQSDLHVIAARLTARIEGIVDGKLTVRLMERAEEGSSRRTWTDSFGEVHDRLARWVPTETLIALDEKRIARSPLDDYRGKAPPSTTLELFHERALARREFLLSVGSQEAAEDEYRRVIAEDPGRVTRDIVYGQGKANFTADDLDALLATHITEGWSDETDRILRDDPTVRVLSADTNSPLYTIEKQADITAKFDTLLRQLLTQQDPLFDRAALDEAIRRVELRHRTTNPDFHGFTAQQLRAFDSFDRRLAVWSGDAGVGKSVLNEVHREMAELTGREIRGFATAQKAADVLAASSGIRSVNQARGIIEESLGGAAVMPENARFVFDEFSMASVEAGVAILERAIEANASGVLQGDLSQLPNIAAGNTFGIATRAAVDCKALVRLSEVFRQKEGSEVAFMREAVPRGGKAIRTAHRAGYAAYVEEFMDRGLVTHHATREAEVAAIASDILDAMRAGQRVIAPGRSFQDCLYVNRAVRAGLGFAGAGHEFEFDRGVIELAAGDRVLFRANNRKLNVRNGDTGTVRAMTQDDAGHWQITVALDNGKNATFDPRRYHKIEYGYASTIHANQGTGAPVIIGSITRSDDARSVHVTVTRAEAVLRVHTHLTRDEILKRLTSDRSLAAKDDALLFQAIVKRTGGPNTPWAKAVKEAQAFDADPLRKRHEAVMAGRADDFRKAIMEILDAGLRPRERDRQLRDAAERYAPDTFVAWAAKEREALEQEWDAMQRVNGEQPEGRHATRDAVPQREPLEARTASVSVYDARRMANLDIALEPCVPVSATPGEQYLAERGIGPIHEGVGFAPNWPAGVTTNSGRVSPGYGPAVVFPFVDRDGDAVAAQGRFITPPIMAGKAMKNWSVGAISRGLFATPDAWESDLVGLCEAPIDALSLAQSGLPALALAGTQNRPAFLATLLAGRAVVLSLDADEPGIAAAQQIENLLRTRSEIAWLQLPVGVKDVNDALLSAPDALVREIERLYQQLLDPLQIAWLRTYRDELGIRPSIRAKTAVALRSMGYLGKHETDLLDRATALAKREDLDAFDGRSALRDLELSRAERELKERVDAELRRAAGIDAPKAPKKTRGPKR